MDHTILLERLQTRFGITGAALKWVESYFENRRQQVLINDVKSDEVHLDCNVPQGSVLGPKFFLVIIRPLTIPVWQILRETIMNFLPNIRHTTSLSDLNRER